MTGPVVDLPPNSPTSCPLRWWGKLLIGVILLSLVGFGGVVVKRSAYLHLRMTDVHVFFRAAWAVRAGEDLYTTTSRGWHYIYPPVFAIVMAPFADPPEGVDRAGMLPYPVSVVAWYIISVLCGLLAIHWLAQACEEALPAEARPHAWSHDWWRHRVVPLLMCMAQFGNTLSRGQVNLLLLLLIAGAVRAGVRDRSFRAGLWLAGAICLKVMPAFLLLYPLWRRDGRWMAGACAGCVLGLVIVPVAVFGPARTWHYAREWSHQMLMPAMGVDPNPTLRTELIGLNTTTNQSIKGVLHAWSNLGVPPRQQSPEPSRVVSMVHWGLGGFFTLVTVAAAAPWRWRRAGVAGFVGAPPAKPAMVMVLSLGSLTSVMLMVSPISHVHYFVLSLTLVVPLAFLAARWEGRGTRWLQWSLALLYAGTNGVVLLPGPLEATQNLRLAAIMGLVLWAHAIVVLWRLARGAVPADEKVF